MLQVIVQSFLRAEATVGVALVVLIITGRTNPQTIALSLTILAVVFLLSGLLVLMRRLPRVPETMTEEEKALQELEKDAGPAVKGRAHWVAARRRHVTSAVSLCVVLLVNAALIYGLSPIAV